MEAVTIRRETETLNGLFEIIMADGFICGGFARYCTTPRVMPNRVSDIDVYAKGDEEYEDIKGRFIFAGWESKKETPVSVTLQKKGMPKLQLIKPIRQGNLVLAGTVTEILENFDFTVARVGIADEGNGLEAVCDDTYEEDELGKKLVIKNIHCPIAQVYRIAKYIRKGYWIGALEIIKIFRDWEERPPEYIENLLGLLEREDPSKEDIDEMERLLHID